MNLVLTIAMGDAYERMAKLTHPNIKAYAKKIGAEFMCIDKSAIAKTSPHWEKFQIHDLLEEYDRILYLDTDMIIRDDCPNLFDEVPEGKLGMFNEASWTDRSKELMIDIARKYETTIPKWDGKYYNSGVMVISRVHKYLFRKPREEHFSFYEQSYLNMQIARLEIPVHDLHYRYNRMTCMDKVTGEERFNSFIIHYAGYPSLDFVLDLIPKDLTKWWKAKGDYTYPHHIYISVQGGLGDQACAEPAIRYMIENVYPDADIRIGTHFPTLFKHLPVPVYEHGKSELEDDVPYLILCTLPGPETVTWSIVSNLLCHTVDYAAMALLRRILPFKDKRIKLEVEPGDKVDLIQTSGMVLSSVKNLIVIHPGRHWQSKTFPTSWWQSTIEGICAGGVPVCIIGENEETRGTVDVTIPNGCVDLRDKLSLDELIALLSYAKILVSNDSGPVHLAGAFDNWIVMIPTCKHPDHVMPFRNGYTHKNVTMYKNLTIDDLWSQPTHIYGTSAEYIYDDWDEYLPDPDDVTRKVLQIHEHP